MTPSLGGMEMEYHLDLEESRSVCFSRLGFQVSSTIAGLYTRYSPCFLFRFHLPLSYKLSCSVHWMQSGKCPEVSDQPVVSKTYVL